MAKTDDPICGNCFAPLSKHFHENEIYCFPNTTGDIFKDEPPDSLILEQLYERHKEEYDDLVLLWKRNNGHIGE